MKGLDREQFRRAAHRSIVAGARQGLLHAERLEEELAATILRDRLKAVQRGAFIDAIVDALYCDIVTTRRPPVTAPPRRRSRQARRPRGM